MEVSGTHSGENEYDQINENTKKVKKRAVAARQPFSLENIKIAVLKRQGKHRIYRMRKVTDQRSVFLTGKVCYNVRKRLDYDDRIRRG